MKPLILLLLICLSGLAVVPGMAADGGYSGGEIQISGPGIYTITVTEVTPAVTPPAPPAPPGTLPVTGSLSITTTPAGALVFIDGVRQGISPITLRGIAPGSHTLLLQLAGYQDLSAPVTITAGQTQSFTTALTQTPAGTGTPAAPIQTPGFAALPGIAALGAALLAKKITR